MVNSPQVHVPGLTQLFPVTHVFDKFQVVLKIYAYYVGIVMYDLG